MDNSSGSLGEIDTNTGRATIIRGDVSQRTLNRSEDDHDRSRNSIDTCDEIPNSESAHDFTALKLKDPESNDHDDNVKHTFNQVYR